MKFTPKISLTTLFITVLTTQILFAQQVIKPSKPIKNRSFAILIDEQSLEKCKTDVLAYRDVIERENLPTYIVSHNWQSPEQVKAEIAKLYKNNFLEGVVFIGDIPIAMIRKGQHLATAFKMDEKFDKKDSSIPSDRYYDDFNLSFDFLEKDDKNPLLFYYNLSLNSSNKIKSNIYSGRIKPIKSNGKDRYLQISNYLKKVVDARKEKNKIDNVFAYLGDGTLSNSLIAWAPEMYRLEEQFPNTFLKSTQAQVYRFDTWNFPKHEIINQLKREDLDIAFIHEHGMPERMYISGDFPTHETSEHFNALQYSLKKLAKREIKNDQSLDNFYNSYVAKYHLKSSIFEDYNSKEFKHQDSIRTLEQGINVEEVDDIKPNVKLTIFDACYNGDFRENDYIAGRFIFSEGKSLIALANSVSILQDVNTTHLIGLLGLGINVGQWAQYNHVLESHVIGDPTFIFSSNNNENLSWIVGENNNNKLLEALKTATSADAKNGILTQLFRNNYNKLAAILENEYNTSKFAITRYTCLDLAIQLGGDIRLALLKKGSKDSDEFIRRHSLNIMADVGDPSLIPFLIEAYLENQHASRVLFSIKMSLYSFDKKLITAIAEEKFAKANVIDKDIFKQNFFKNQFQGFYNDLDSIIFNEKSTSKKLGISALKNINYHPSINKYIDLVKNNNEDLKTRIAMLESLAWFGQSYQKRIIEDACKKIAEDKSYPEEIRTQSIRTLNTIK